MHIAFKMHKKRKIKSPIHKRIVYPRKSDGTASRKHLYIIIFTSDDLVRPSDNRVLSIPSVIAATATRLQLQLFTHGSPFTACIDTGADCSLLTEKAYHHLNKLYGVPLSKETRVFQAAQGSPLNIVGSVIFCLCLSIDRITHSKLDFLLS